MSEFRRAALHVVVAYGIYCAVIIGGSLAIAFAVDTHARISNRRLIKDLNRQTVSDLVAQQVRAKALADEMAALSQRFGDEARRHVTSS